MEKRPVREPCKAREIKRYGPTRQPKAEHENLKYSSFSSIATLIYLYVSPKRSSSRQHIRGELIKVGPNMADLYLPLKIL